MNVQEAKEIAAQHAGNLCVFLEGVFGDAATAEKFARFALQRLEIDFDEIEASGTSAAPLYVLAREVCREYVSAATFARLPLATGDAGLPLSGALPATPEALVLALPRAARLALRLIVVDGLTAADVAPVFGFTPAHLAQFLERVGAACKLGALGASLERVATLVAAEPVAASAAPAGAPASAARRTTRRTPVNTADSGSVPRGVSLSPLVSGGHPANRGHSPYTRPFPTRQVAALPPPAPAKNPMVAAALVAFLVLCSGPLSGFLGKAAPKAAAAVIAAPASPRASARVDPASVPGAIGTVELPGGAIALMPGQLVVAPVHGEAHARLAHVQIWLANGARAEIHADRVVLQDGVARVQVDEGAQYLGLAEPLELKLTAGTYLLRRGDKRGTGLCTLAGRAEVVGKSGSGMRAEAGRSVTVGREGVEVRDASEGLDDGWGRESVRVARAVADAGHFSALPEDAAPVAPLAAMASTGAGGRALFAAADSAQSAGSRSARGIGADRGAAGYRQAF